MTEAFGEMRAFVLQNAWIGFESGGQVRGQRARWTVAPISTWTWTCMYVNTPAMPTFNASVMPDLYHRNLYAPSLETVRRPLLDSDIYNFDLTPSNRNLTSLSALVDGFHSSNCLINSVISPYSSVRTKSSSNTPRIANGKMYGFCDVVAPSRWN